VFKLENWVVLESEVAFSASPWLEVTKEKVLLPDGKIVDDYYQIKVPDYAVIFAETKSGDVVVERHYKHGTRTISFNLPAGAIEIEEDPLGAAQRELIEETGYASDDWQALGVFVVHGNYGCCKAHFFKANNSLKTSEPKSGDLEQMEIILIKHEDLLELFAEGAFPSMSNAALISMATNSEVNFYKDDKEN